MEWNSSLANLIFVLNICNKIENLFFFQTTQIPILREFYSRALQNFESGVNEKDGLRKAINGGYAFFVIETMARRALRKAFVQERCLIKELQIQSAPGSLALPMDINSPYKKIINLW